MPNLKKNYHVASYQTCNWEPNLSSWFSLCLTKNEWRTFGLASKPPYLVTSERASYYAGPHLLWRIITRRVAWSAVPYDGQSVASSQSGSQGPVYAVPTMTLSRRPTISGPRNPQSTANQGPLYAVSSPITAGSTFNAPTEPLPAIPDDAAPPSSPPAAHPVRAPPPPPVPAGPPSASEWANPYAQIAAGGGQGEGENPYLKPMDEGTPGDRGTIYDEVEGQGRSLKVRFGCEHFFLFFDQFYQKNILTCACQNAPCHIFIIHK